MFSSKRILNVYVYGLGLSSFALMDFVSTERHRTENTGILYHSADMGTLTIDPQIEVVVPFSSHARIFFFSGGGGRGELSTNLSLLALVLFCFFKWK